MRGDKSAALRLTVILAHLVGILDRIQQFLDTVRIEIEPYGPRTGIDPHDPYKKIVEIDADLQHGGLDDSGLTSQQHVFTRIVVKSSVARIRDVSHCLVLLPPGSLRASGAGGHLAPLRQVGIRLYPVSGERRVGFARGSGVARFARGAREAEQREGPAWRAREGG